MLVKEYRICMPLTVEEYRIGQLYMIAKHSSDESKDGEGVEVIENRPIDDPEHGKGQFTEKRIYLSSRLPSWVRKFVPNVFYVTEKAWNFYPFTKTEYTFAPFLHIFIYTKFENNSGTSNNCLDLPEDKLGERVVEFVDIVNDPVSEHKYKSDEDLTRVKSDVTGRGPWNPDWLEKSDPVMCSYKCVEVSLAKMFLIQSRVENFIHTSIREILLLGHKQAVAWLDEWHGMTTEEVREYERRMQEETNEKLREELNRDKESPSSTPSSTLSTPKSPGTKKFPWWRSQEQ